MNQSPPSLSEFGVATFQGLFGTVTRLKVGFAAEAALLELGSDFGRSRLVRRRSLSLSLPPWRNPHPFRRRGPHLPLCPLPTHPARKGSLIQAT